MFDLLLENGILSDGTKKVQLAIENGIIVQKSTGQKINARQTIDLQERLIIPGFVESHLHLDIALMNRGDRPGRPFSFVYPSELNQDLEKRRKYFTSEDIIYRAGSALAMASRHGVTALRAQCHVDKEVGLKHVEALLQVRERWKNRIDIQIVAFPQQGLLDQPGTLDLFREAFRMGVDVMGCASNLDPAATDMENVRRHIDTALDLAMEMDVDFDIHADLGLPDSAGWDDLEVVHAARRTIETGYQKRVTVGHVCALDSVEPDEAKRVIDYMAEAKLNVISQPDMQRLARNDARSVRRGLTRVKQLLTAGVNVAFASNNVRDSYRSLGNFNLLEEGLILAYGAHMDTVTELETLLCMCTENAARALRLEKYGLNVGDKADLVVLDAGSPSAALVGQVEKLYVIKNGKHVVTNMRRTDIYHENERIL